MNFEFSYGAVLYTKKNDIYEYLIIKDRHESYSFPKGHIKKNETEMECAVREVKEETGIDMVPNPSFFYGIEYPIGNSITKYVYYYMADIKEMEPYINDGEVKEILLLPYEESL